jgi:hypothetical protein
MLTETAKDVTQENEELNLMNAMRCLLVIENELQNGLLMESGAQIIGNVCEVQGFHCLARHACALVTYGPHTKLKTGSGDVIQA